jgi:hypothetical protein
MLPSGNEQGAKPLLWISKRALGCTIGLGTYFDGRHRSAGFLAACTSSSLETRVE